MGARRAFPENIPQLLPAAAASSAWQTLSWGANSQRLVRFVEKNTAHRHWDSFHSVGQNIDRDNNELVCKQDILGVSVRLNPVAALEAAGDSRGLSVRFMGHCNGLMGNPSKWLKGRVRTIYCPRSFQVGTRRGDVVPTFILHLPSYSNLDAYFYFFSTS